MTRWYQPVLLVVLGGAGIGLIAVGSNLMGQHQLFEMAFQYKLLDRVGSDYHWRSIGDGYFGLGAVIAGTFLITVAATVVLVSRALERPNAITKNDVEPAAGTGRGHRQRDRTRDEQTGFADDSIGRSGGGKHARCDPREIWEL